MSKPNSTWHVLIALSVLAIAVLPFLDWIPDDAYISLQYAQSLADGDGLVFNPGERVEGFSNLLWTLLLAGVAKGGGSIARWAPLLGLLCAALAVIGILRELRSWLGGQVASPLVLGCAAIITGTYFPLAFYATSGLETPFYLLLLVTGVVFHLRGRVSDDSRHQVISCAAFFLAALTRPEAVAFLLVNALVVLRRGDRVGRLTVILTLLGYVGVAIARFDYYGAWLPNTYLAKPGFSVSYGTPVLRGLHYLARFFVKSGFVLLVPAALLIPKKPQTRTIWFYLWMLVGIQLAFIVFVGADVLRFDRFTVPLFPWLLALAAIAAQERMTTVGNGGHARIARVAIAVTMVIVALNVAQSYRANSKYCVHDWMHANAQKAIGIRIGQMVPDASAIVTNEVGAVRFYSGIPVVDMLGLTDATVAAIRFESFQQHSIGTSPAAAAAVADYLIGRHPDVVLLPSTRRLNTEQPAVHRDTMHPLWYSLFTHPDFVANYEVAEVARIHDNKFVYIYLRNNITARTPAQPTPTTCLDFQSQ